MDKQTLAKVLSKLHFTSKLPEAVQERLAATASGKKYAAGQVLFRENSQHEELMIIWTGKVALDMRVPGRGKIRVLTLGPGELVGWSALLGGGHMTTSAVVTEDAQIISLAGPELLAACESDHSFGYFLMNKVAGALASRLTDTRRQLLDLLSFEQSIQLDTKTGKPAK